MAVEQAGTYVESYSKIKNLQLTEDEIQVLASGLMEVTILDKKRSIAGDGFNFSVKIRAIVHPDKMEEMAKRVKEKSVVGDYKKVQEAYDKSQKEIEALKHQLTQAKNDKEKNRVEARITDAERSFQANEWLEKGEQAWLNEQNDAAIEAYTKAIGLSPNYAKAYYLRGAAYNARKQSEKAMLDCQKACQLGDQDGCYLMETTLKMKMLLEWDPLKAPEGFDFNKEYEKELKKLKQRN
nr:tetratricopeptide repeat protein [Nitrospirota bacterium]